MAEEEQRKLDEEEVRMRAEQIKYDSMVAAREQRKIIEERDAADREEKLKSLLREKKAEEMRERKRRYDASVKGQKDKYKAFLKNSGWNARSAGNMKLETLIEHYERTLRAEKRAAEEDRKLDEMAKKKKEDEESRKRKAPETKPPVKPAQPTETPKEKYFRLKRAAKPGSGPKMKKSRVSSSEEEKKDEEKEEEADVGAEVGDEVENDDDVLRGFCVETPEPIDVVPLAMIQPLSDWLRVTNPGKILGEIRVIRVDGSFEDYTSFMDLLRKITREDLIEMYEIGRRRYA